MKKIKLLTLGFLALFGLGSFCSSVSISDNLPIILSGSKTVTTNSNYTIFDLNSYYTGGVSQSTYCVRWTSDPAGIYGTAYKFGFSNNFNGSVNTLYPVYGNQFGEWICPIADKRYFNGQGLSGKTITYEVFNLNDLLNMQSSSGGGGGSNYFSGLRIYTPLGYNDYTINEFINNNSFQYTDGFLEVSIEDNYDVISVNTSSLLSFGQVVLNTTDGAMLQSCQFNGLCPACSYSGYVLESVYQSCLSDYNNVSGQLNNCQSSISGYDNSLTYCTSSLNSCQNNLNSCLSANCPISGSDVSWSALYINNIQHLGSPIINFTIPEEISWDYSYQGDVMDIDVEGYNVDYDYINNVVDIQSYKPSDEDFNNIIGILAQYMPIIVIFVGLLFLYKLLKKPFKSKL